MKVSAYDKEANILSKTPPLRLQAYSEPDTELNLI